MRKIKLFPASHTELRLDVSDEMEKDYQECRRMAQSGDDSMGKTIVVCSNDDCVYRGDNGECGKDIIYLDDLGTCEDSE